MTLIETIIASLIAMFVTAITWLAYKHPPAYDKLYKPLVFLSATVFISLQLYNFGLTKAAETIIEQKVAMLTKDLLITAIKAKEIPWKISLIIFWVFIAFLIFLAFLPVIIKDGKNNKPK